MNILVKKSQLYALFTAQSVLITLFCASIYLIISLLIPNFRILTTVFESHSHFFSKLSFFFILLLGSFKAYTLLENILFLVTALLIGLNLALSFKMLRDSSKATSPALIGGQTVLGLVVAGCSSCGTPILSIVAASVGVGLLPLQLQLLQILTIILLAASLFYTLQKSGVCKVIR